MTPIPSHAQHYTWVGHRGIAALATGVRWSDALNADRKLKEQQELWEAKRKKKRYKTTSTVTSGKKLMFKGSGKCPTVEERVNKSVEEHCSSHGSNRGDSGASTRACPEPDPMRKVKERY